MTASISRTRGICGGRPTITGRRLQPVDIWSRLDHGETVAEVAADFELPREAVLLCKQLLDFARAYVRDEDARARREGRRIPARRWSR